MLPPDDDDLDLALDRLMPGEAKAPSPEATTPSYTQVNRATTAAWTAGGRTYLLVADGDISFLRKYL